MKHLSLFFILFALILNSCTKNQEEVTNSSKINLTDGEYNFDNYMENIRNIYNGTDKVIAVEFELTSDDNIQIKKFSELQGVEATLALVTSKINLSDNSFLKSGGCSDKDISKGNCYEISCHSTTGTTTSRCTGGAFGSCLGIGKDCLEAGGCVEVCKVPPRVLYIPAEFKEIDIDNDIKELITPEQFHFFVGESL